MEKWPWMEQAKSDWSSGHFKETVSGLCVQALQMAIWRAMGHIQDSGAKSLPSPVDDSNTAGLY